MLLEFLETFITSEVSLNANLHIRQNQTNRTGSTWPTLHSWESALLFITDLSTEDIDL